MEKMYELVLQNQKYKDENKSTLVLVVDLKLLKRLNNFMNLVTKKVNNNTFDAFIGEGWENWGRFKIKFGKEQKELFQVKGVRFPKAYITELTARYNSK
jgi:hypothetical protein